MDLKQQVMTVEDFWKEYEGRPFELVNGEVVEIMPTGYEHGSVQRRTAARIGDFVDANKLGDVVGGETGFWLSPITLRAADVAYISLQKLQSIEERGKYLPFAPDLAIEIVSPTDRADEVETKVRQYLQAGTRLVWVIYPELRQLVAHYPDGTSKRIDEAGTADGEDALPGLRIPIKDLFPPPAE